VPGAGAEPGVSLRLAIAALAMCAAVASAAQSLPAPPASGTPPPPSVGSGPASTEEVVVAAQDCATAVSPGRFDRETFAARGWIMAAPATTIEVRPGLTTRQAMFGRSGGQVVNIIRVTGNALVHCVVVARLSEPAQHSAVRSALISSLGLTPATDPIAEERDTQFAANLPAANRANLLLSPARRVTVELQEPTLGPMVRIEIFPKRPLET
jgi:hypothetical protein